MKKITLLLFVLSYATVAKSEPEKIENITVTSSRTPMQIHESGSALTIITREDILRRNAGNLAELLREVPGMAVSQQGSKGSITQLRVRGAEANHVLVLIDGVEANDISQGSEFNFSTLKTTDIERVEIVRGPQSALWGSDALSGVINVVTRSSGNPRSGLSIALESGSFDTSNLAIAGRRVGEQSQLKVSLDRLDTSGNNISRHGDENDGYENTTLNLVGSFEPRNKMQIDYSLRQTKTTTEFDAIDFISTGLPSDAPHETDSTQRYSGISASWNLLDGNLNQRLSLSMTDTANVNKTGSPTPDTTRGNKRQLQYQANYYQDSHVLSAILERETEDYEQRGRASFFGDPNKDLDTSTRSAAFEWRYNMDVLDLSLGGRYDDNSTFDSSRSWRATAAWHLLESVSLFSSVGESVKNPTFVETFGFFDNFLGNPNLRPEESLSWEIGIRQTLLHERAQFSASWFHATLNNEINGFVFDAAKAKFTAENASQESERKGAEFQFTFRLTEAISLQTTYTYLDATQETATGGDTTEVRRPANVASFSANFTFPRSNISLTALYNGKQEDNFFPPYPPYQERVDLDAYTLVNLSGNYQLNQHVIVTGKLENLFDEEYEEVYGFQPQGFSAYAGVRISF